MPKEYSLYEAKAKLSALVRQVREGQSFVITVHGEPVAELRAVERPAGRQSLTERIAELERAGAISPAKQRPSESDPIPRLGHVPGALQRFLEERD